ncbi:MAG: hypothetical protein HC860_16275 [Alkalinema sp. RU_4_3]|nr:hypothetical protein [Alkalinema sp. RU_4_3]
MGQIQQASSDIFSLMQWDLSEFDQHNSLTIEMVKGQAIRVETLMPRDVQGFWQKYLLIVQAFLTQPLKKMPLEAQLPRRKLINSSDRQELDLMIHAMSEIVSWQLLYKFAEQKNFQVRCNSRIAVKAIEPGISVRLALLKLCQSIYPGDYAGHYRDWLHWFCCLWHEDCSTRRKLTDPPSGKRKSVNKLRTLTQQYGNSENPHDENQSPHHYRLVKTALEQPLGSKSRRLWQDYIESLKSYTALLDSPSFNEWHVGQTSIKRSSRGRPAKNLS